MTPPGVVSNPYGLKRVYVKSSQLTCVPRLPNTFNGIGLTGPSNYGLSFP